MAWLRMPYQSRPTLLAPPAGHVFQVFAVAVQPVDGGKVAGRGQGFIQRPEAADEALGVLGDRLGEVTAGGETAPMTLTEPVCRSGFPR